MRIEHVAVAIGALALAQAQEPPSPTPGTTSAPHSQIVVIAPRDVGIDTSRPVPRLLGGQWQFERGGQFDSGTASNVATQRIPSTGSGTRRPFALSVCLPNDSLEGALQQLAGDRSSMPNPTQFCGRLRMDVGQGKIGER